MVASIVLVGGKGLRMGGDKASQLLAGKTLLERVVERLALLGGQILIVGSSRRIGCAVDAEIQYVDDLYPGRGPLGGIYTGLVVADSLYSLVVACDFPFLDVEFLRHMVGLSPGFDAVVPRMDRAQPLQAVYSKSCLGNMKERLERGWLGVTRFLGTVNVRYVDQDECRIFDPQLLSLFNVNSAEDLIKAGVLEAERQVSVTDEVGL
ncbi:MAG: molybdenum cofactor guanylyltransferase [Dehalococcoidia bacterium]|nr:molybdenum cofactor guanylyltransferase [Dehalococcoidia bacterium]